MLETFHHGPCLSSDCQLFSLSNSLPPTGRVLVAQTRVGASLTTALERVLQPRGLRVFFGHHWGHLGGEKQVFGIELCR